MYPNETFYHISRLAGATRVMVENIVGAYHAQRMYESRSLAEAYLNDTNGELRFAAMQVLAHHWGPNAQFVDVLTRLARDDSDSNVRVGALRCLGTFYYGIDDPAIGRMAAEIVYDDAQPAEVRLAAYRSLCMLRRRSGPAHNILHHPDLRFPEHVDWYFVDSFLHHLGNGEKDAPG